MIKYFDIAESSTQGRLMAARQQHEPAAGGNPAENLNNPGKEPEQAAEVPMGDCEQHARSLGLRSIRPNAWPTYRQVRL